MHLVNYSQKGLVHLLNNSYFLRMGLVHCPADAVFRAGCFKGFGLYMIHLLGCALMAKNGQGTFFQNIDVMH